MNESTGLLDAECAICKQNFKRKQQEQCLTDCGHVYCLTCICLNLCQTKNACPVCHSIVRVVRQMNASGNDEQREKPCSVKFCNATYILYVSIWSVQDPTTKLAKLFHL